MVTVVRMKTLHSWHMQSRKCAAKLLALRGQLTGKYRQNKAYDLNRDRVSETPQDVRASVCSWQ